jgi:transposase
MIAPPPNVRVWLAAGVTDMRKGFDGLAVLVQQHLGQDPFSGQLFAFRGFCQRSCQQVELGR